MVSRFQIILIIIGEFIVFFSGMILIWWGYYCYFVSMGGLEAHGLVLCCCSPYIVRWMNRNLIGEMY